MISVDQITIKCLSHGDSIYLRLVGIHNQAPAGIIWSQVESYYLEEGGSELWLCPKPLSEQVAQTIK